MTLFTAITESAQGILPVTMALSAVALIGYLFGHRTRRSTTTPIDDKLNFELARAVQIAKELQQVAHRIRQDVSSHQSRIARFKSRVGNLQRDESPDGWQALSDEAEELLVPTMKLTTNLSFAYDQLRQQTSQLMNFASSRTDPQTGVHNRRALEEHLQVLFSIYTRNNSRFSLALFSREGSGLASSPTDQTDDQLRQFVAILESSARETDLVGRYSTDEFLVLMPHTSLAGATVYSERLLARLDAEVGCVTGGGIVEVQTNDTPEKILSRAGSALYSARTNESSCLYLHYGNMVRPHPTKAQQPQETSSDESEDAVPLSIVEPETALVSYSI